MSSYNNKSTIPPRWLNCPRKAIRLIRNKFLAFKTPLSSAFNDQVPEECWFTIDMLFSSLRSEKIKLGLWIDLTNTTRFYDKKSLEAHGCKYLKIQCKGHDERPSNEQTNFFIHVCKQFIAQNPLDVIGVHCTHGFNRTGFLIISYLVEMDCLSVDAGLAEFAAARPPGVYKGDYIKELYKRYDEEEEAPDPPPRPAWCLEYDDSNEEDTDEGPSVDNSPCERENKKKRKEHHNKNPVFMAGVSGVTPILDQKKLSGIQKCVQKICSWELSGFPGSQPVSMDLENIRLLHEKPYRVSWKADGTRYMMLIQANREVYFIDRDNSVFQVDGLTFPHPRDLSKCLKDTLLDGEMVIDKVCNKEYARYLAYDIVMFDGKDVSKLPFHPDRYEIIEKAVIKSRHKALMEGRIRKEREPFSIRLKHFWDVVQAANLLSDKFAKNLSHEPDGLIFQPSKEPYRPGPCPEVLKWKPLSMNSVDFKLKIVTETGVGILPRKVGHLFVGGWDVPYSQMKITKQIKDLNNAIIECKLENGQWVFMRVRADKSFPNSKRTADAVFESIRRPVKTSYLLEYIEKHKFLEDDSDLMPPPKKRSKLD